jgi:phosphoribosylglycinamide formyltransferase 1
MKLAILISGRGSNLQAILDAARQPAWPAPPVLVLSNRPSAEGLTLAKASGIAAEAIDHKAFASREAFEQATDAALRAAGAELVACAGFMRVLTPWFVTRWAGRLINIHPSLLPAFPGTDTHARALAAGVAAHGCTVHMVVPEVDAGPILGQGVLRVGPEDTAETLAARTKALEHRLYPACIAAFARGDIRLADGQTKTAPDIHRALRIFEG